ncbi:MAG: MoaD/ThiS family protein [Gemmatimonadetes bacterium]|nr:MoaD/ThiS family protein [Gemmatimonadota bacterium]
MTRVLLFASYADALGTSAIDVALPERATVADLLAEVRALAAAHALPPAPLVAVNQEYAALDVVLREGDEIAIIPPVAGG